jgi:hypothetical protein
MDRTASALSAHHGTRAPGRHANDAVSEHRSISVQSRYKSDHDIASR